MALVVVLVFFSLLISQFAFGSSHCVLVLMDNANSSLSLQTVGFVGPGLCLIGLTTAKNPSIGSAWLTLAFGLKSFSHSGFLVNLQVSDFSHFKDKYILLRSLVTLV